MKIWNCVRCDEVGMVNDSGFCEECMALYRRKREADPDDVVALTNLAFDIAVGVSAISDIFDSDSSSGSDYSGGGGEFGGGGNSSEW